MNPRVFREYDIRGVADSRPRRRLVARPRPGDRRAPARERARGASRSGATAALTSPRLHAALLERGCCDAGSTSSTSAWSPRRSSTSRSFHLDADGGVMITGSHNPPEDNGFKILRGKTTIHGAEIQSCASAIEERDVRPAPRRHGRATRDIVHAPTSRYVRSTHRSWAPRRFKVVVDAGNGAGGPTAVAAATARSASTSMPLYCELDGRFPNHHPDPTSRRTSPT